MTRDIFWFGIRNARNNDAYKRNPKMGERKYKMVEETYEGGLIKEYFIIGPEGVWCEGHDNPKAAIHEALAVIPGISINDIDFWKYKEEVGRIE